MSAPPPLSSAPVSRPDERNPVAAARICMRENSLRLTLYELKHQCHPRFSDDPYCPKLPCCYDWRNASRERVRPRPRRLECRHADDRTGEQEDFRYESTTRHRAPCSLTTNCGCDW